MKQCSSDARSFETTLSPFVLMCSHRHRLQHVRLYGEKWAKSECWVALSARAAETIPPLGRAASRLWRETIELACSPRYYSRPEPLPIEVEG